MPVKRCVLHGERIRTLDDLYDQLAECLHFPAYFGRNLDALWDVLSTDIEGPLEIVWQNTESSKQTLGPDFDRIVSLFADLEDERDDFSVTYE